MKRPDFKDIYMRLALDLANRSTCSRLHVGTVITSWDYRHVYAIGYNGGPIKQQNECLYETPGACGCLCSEANAIINCNASRDLHKRIFVTVSPCARCATMIVNLGGVKEVYYRSSYRSNEGIKILKKANIKVKNI